MISIKAIDFDCIPIDENWSFSVNREVRMHSIHAYPAKFPAFIASKAFEYALLEGVNVQNVADVFCGCGTVALEAKLHDKNFWGCDINPVATLIAIVKSQSYNIEDLEVYFSRIKFSFTDSTIPDNVFISSNQRLQYWFKESSYIDLYKIKQAIEIEVPNGKYKDAFLCIFSSILKVSSKWLTKSIKPQLDPSKKEINVFKTFTDQYNKFVRAVLEIKENGVIDRTIEIYTENFLNVQSLPNIDLIISSPPYVTSYEYADLHQLSTLWLDFEDDYRNLRSGSIGSVYNSEDFKLNLDLLNEVGRCIVQKLINSCQVNAKVRAVGRYYLDMQKAVQQCARMMNDAGMVFFVVGDTEYKGVQIKNSEHLIQCLRDEGFKDIKIAKRRISKKLLTPYRDNEGRFSSDKSQRTIYHEEFIISGRMWR